MTVEIRKIVADRLKEITGIEPMPCRSCGEPIVFVKTVRGGAMPLDLELRNHFLTCPKDDEHRRRARR